LIDSSRFKYHGGYTDFFHNSQNSQLMIPIYSHLCRGLSLITSSLYISSAD
jgi:hypothetical protein